MRKTDLAELDLFIKKLYEVGKIPLDLYIFLLPQGFWSQRAKNPRRHLRSPRVI